MARLRPRRRTPSGAEESQVTAEQIFSIQAAAARNFGTTVHEIFETIEWWTETKEEVFRSLRTAENEEAWALVETCFAAPAVQAAHSKPTPLAEVWREKSFEVLLEGVWLSGTFDRVTIERNESGNAIAATILDYKTDRVSSPEEINGSVEVYRPQLTLYRTVLASMLGISENKIHVLLYFKFL